MKKLYLLAVILLWHLFVSAQTVITVSPGTDLYLSPGTVFSSGGLSITPSSGFTLSDISLTQTTTVSHFTANSYASRVYQFSNTTSPFNGTIQFSYDDAELNGLNETGLRVNIHDGSSWQSVNSTTNDATNNYVLTNAVTDKLLNEMALADVFATLPLQWGNISAHRFAQTIKIEWTTKQESNVSHFTVERSGDGRNWNIVMNNIAATNTSSARQYAATDNDHNSSRLYYRIKQTDLDGRSAYSRVVAVSAENDITRVVIYPNPVSNSFSISNNTPHAIKQVQLYNNAGILVKTWTGLQYAYDIQDMRDGIYQLRIVLKNGQSQHFKINKQ